MTLTAKPLHRGAVQPKQLDPSDLRIALFSGNYNYVLDGANLSLNRLVGYLLRQGAQVRVYSPTVDEPAFEPTGDLVSVPSAPIPLRPEYRFPLALTPRVKRDLADFNPNVLHISSPDIVSHRAISWARRRKIATVASVHTRFDTYLAYYHLQSLEPVARAIMRRLYRRCDAIMAPAESTAAVLRAQRMNRDIAIWARGIDRERFNPARRDLDVRRKLGIGDDEVVIAFLGRIVMEKGLDVFADAIHALEARKVPHRVLVIGDGPARAWFEQQLPGANFLGQRIGEDLAVALASADILLNPSVTESFGNVTLEAMACGLPVVAADATGASNLVRDGESGTLVDPTDIDGFADALQTYAEDANLRARHGLAGVDFAKTMDWDRINSVVIRTYIRAIAKRERLARMTGR